jgi:aminobenzoyl-glutamate utilization protein B
MNQAIVSWLNKHAVEFYPYADAIWSYSELGGEEFLSSALLIKLLESHGFKVDAGVAGMPTAFIAKWGDGEPIIGFSCEYDALPGLSQHPGSEKKSVVEGAPGQGCGHNLLGVGGAMAAVALKEWMAGGKVPGTVKVLGTPAEEVCVGKPYMARSGLFEGFDAILDWHPGKWNHAGYKTCNAFFNLKFHFSGRTGHGNSPWTARSALDSALLMGHALEMLREHIPPGQPEGAHTIGYTFSDVGPEYPNVISDRASIWVVGRLTTTEQSEDVVRRIQKCAEGASLATDTSWSMEFITATHERIPNKILSTLFHRHLTDIGPTRFDAYEQDMAKKMQRDLGVPEIGLLEQIEDLQPGTAGVTDNSEYSWHAPLGMLWTVTAPFNVGAHNWQVAACSGTSIGKKGMTLAAKVLASSASELLQTPQLLEEARKEFKERLKGRAYHSLIPERVRPPLTLNHVVMEKYRPLMEAHYKQIKIS